MDKRDLVFVAVFGFLTTVGEVVSAHPGGLDKNGGHVDKSSGVYHCHRAGCVLPSGGVRGGNARVAAGPKFDRSEWGGWKDVDRDCQDTRAEVLQRDSVVAVTFADGRACVVERGRWLDRYTGDQFSHALSLDIDHIVPLEWAHRHGGARWSRQRKQAFANDVDNLIVAGTGVNRDKGAQGPDKWLPYEEGFRCIYLSRFLHVYAKYGLQFAAAEKVAVTPLAVSCDLVL